jgi:hypothetical protein
MSLYWIERALSKLERKGKGSLALPYRPPLRQGEKKGEQRLMRLPFHLTPGTPRARM